MQNVNFQEPRLVSDRTVKVIAVKKQGIFLSTRGTELTNMLAFRKINDTSMILAPKETGS